MTILRGLAPHVYGDDPVTRGLISQWWARRADGANPRAPGSTSTTWKDLVGTNDATLTGMTFNETNIDGWIGDGIASPHGVRFNGTSGYSLAGNPSNLQFSVGTIECWMESSLSQAGANNFLLGKENAYSLFVANTGVIQYYGWGGAGGIKTTSSANVLDGKPHHIVHTFDSGANQGLLYLDGVNVATTNGSQYAATNQTGNFKFGGLFTAGFPDWFKGAIHMVRAYNVVLTAAEAAQNFRAGVY